MTPMAKLKIDAVLGQKPVKISIELAPDIDRDLRAYAELMKRETGHSIEDPTKLIAPMLKRFMATDRSFRRFRRQMAQERGG
jgi:hypothetical protein